MANILFLDNFDPYLQSCGSMCIRSQRHTYRNDCDLENW